MSQQTAAAAKFYLQTQGFTGTTKQIEKLLKQMQGNTEAVIRLATERGFKS